jgi:hypothetical protein
MGFQHNRRWADGLFVASGQRAFKPYIQSLA